MIRKQRERKSGLNSVLALISICVLFYVLLAHQVTSMLFQPQPASYEEGIPFYSVAAEDGTALGAFWQPTPGARRTVYYFHGNAEDLGDIRFVLENYALQGVNVLALDYRGYGISGGSPKEQNTFDDAERVLDHAIAEWGVDPERLVFHGRSLGGGIATELASRRDCEALILESAFESVFRVKLPLDWMPGDKYRNYEKLPEVSVPVLLMHGRRDNVIPFAHGEALAELVPEERRHTLWFDDAGHNDILSVASPRYWAALRQFLAMLDAETP